MTCVSCNNYSIAQNQKSFNGTLSQFWILDPSLRSRASFGLLRLRPPSSPSTNSGCSQDATQYRFWILDFHYAIFHSNDKAKLDVTTKPSGARHLGGHFQLKNSS